MAITKRTRFEVLRRDEHTCQYCGAKAPDVVLQIDHVVPMALGGSDKPDNLVTACKDCNAGKTSIAPDAPIVQKLSAEASAYALGMMDKMTRFREDVESLDDYVDEFLAVWENWGSGEGDERTTVPLPPEYRMSLFKWKQMGIPVSVFALAIPTAMTRTTVKRPDKFSYMAGIVWNMVNQREIDYSVTDETAAVFTSTEAEKYVEQEWQQGFAAGKRRGLKEAAEEAAMGDLLAHHIDNTFPYGEVNPFTKEWEFKGVKKSGQGIRAA